MQPLTAWFSTKVLWRRPPKPRVGQPRRPRHSIRPAAEWCLEDRVAPGDALGGLLLTGAGVGCMGDMATPQASLDCTSYCDVVVVPPHADSDVTPRPVSAPAEEGSPSEAPPQPVAEQPAEQTLPRRHGRSLSAPRSEGEIDDEEKTETPQRQDDPFADIWADVLGPFGQTADGGAVAFASAPSAVSVGPAGSTGVSGDGPSGPGGNAASQGLAGTADGPSPSLVAETPPASPGGFSLFGDTATTIAAAASLSANSSPVGIAPPSGPVGASSSGLSASGVTIDPVEGSTSSMVVATFTDSDGNTNPAFYTATIQWGDGSSGPGTVTYSAGTFQVTGSHNYSDEGSYSVVVTIHDIDGATYTVNSSLTVSDAPLSWSGGSPSFTWSTSPTPSPTITNPGLRSNAEGDSVSLQVVASDPGNYPLTYDAIGLPVGLSINSSTGLITGTVGYSDAESLAGSYSPTVMVADGHGGSASASFTWTVSATDRAPTLTNPGNQTSALGSSVSLQLNASDLDSDTLIYDATGLPSGLSVDSSTGLISGTPDRSAASPTPYAVTVTASDASLTASQ